MRPRAAPAATTLALELQSIPLWDAPVPDAKGDSTNDTPTLTVVGTDGAVANGAAVVVAPGGGYQGLATGHEGRQVADWFAAHGVTAFVLRYRLVSHGYRHPVQLRDAKRAIRWVRANAGKYGIDPRRIGMVGFSAGGHLTAMASTLFDAGKPDAADVVQRASSRPDFAVLVYPVISSETPLMGQLGLIDDNATEQDRREIAPAANVSATTPPTFIVHTTADELVSPDNAITYYQALRAAGVPAEMHIFEQGRHGLGLALSDAIACL